LKFVIFFQTQKSMTKAYFYLCTTWECLEVSKGKLWSNDDK